MNWESFYLICFLVGLCLSAVSLLGGMGHFGGHMHVPHVPHAAHLPHAGHVGHVPQRSGGIGHGAGPRDCSVVECILAS